MERLKELRDLVTLLLKEAHCKQTRGYNKGRRDCKYEVGDRVFKRLVTLSSKVKQTPSNLNKRYHCLFRVFWVRSHLVYELANGNG